MAKKERVGIYGGSFSPIHCGHVRAAHEFIRAAALDKLFVVPSGTPFQKEKMPEISAADRLAMTQIAFRQSDEYKRGKICVSDIEVSSTDRSYTVDTLEHFAAPNRQLFLLLGTDKLFTLDRWYRVGDIFSLVEIMLVKRGCQAGNEALIEQKMSEYCERYSARISVIDCETLEISSTRIRQRICDGKSVDGLVPEGVEKYIHDRKLYRGTND